MSDENLLYNTKMVLKYLVNNGPPFQTVDSINYDFHNYTGLFIPYFELGYYYLMTFLQSIPDTLEVDLTTFQIRPSPLQIEDLPPFWYNKNKKRAPLQCNPFMLKPTTFTRALPWTQYGQKPCEPNKTLLKPLSIKEPDTISEKNDESLPISLGHRSNGDGKCSSPDSTTTENGLNLKTKPQEHSDDSTDDVILVPKVFENDQEIFGVDKSNATQFKYSSSNEYELKFDEKKEEVLYDVSSVLSTCLSPDLSASISMKFDETPPPPYLEKQDTLIESENYDYDQDYYLSSSDEKASQCSNNSAIPFMFTEDDDKINMLSSCFFNGKYGSKYETTNIGDVMKVGSVYELFVSEVNNPYKFWFQLDEEHPNPVDEMQKQLNMVYNFTETPDLIKKEHMKKGYACAALYCNTWHRGEILGPPIDGRVNIFFVDYGTVDKIATDNIRYLVKSFSLSPKLCHRGTLDFVKPTDFRWDLNATSFFIGLVSDRKLIAGVSDIDYKTNSVRLYLMDSKSNTNINYMLVTGGFAYTDDPRERYQPHIADVLPSFESLEKGDHATFSEVTILLQQNYDYEKLAQSSIIDEFDCFIPQCIPNEKKIQLMQDFQTKKEADKLLAEKRDAKIFLQIFGKLMNNPFFNGMTSEEVEIKATNPFLD